MPRSRQWYAIVLFVVPVIGGVGLRDRHLSWCAAIHKKGTRMSTRQLRRMLALVLLLAAALPLSAAWAGQGQGQGNPNSESVLFFASDGMRQDLVSSFAGQILMPTMREL